MDQSLEADAHDRRAAWGSGIIQLIFVFVIIAGAVALSSALNGKATENAPQIASLSDTASLSVRVIQPATLTYTPTLALNGTVQANAEIAVSPQVSGEIVRVSTDFRTGTEVSKGAFLFEIDRSDYLLAVQQSDAEIAAARSDLKQLEAEARIARQEWQELYPNREVNDLAARIPQIEAAQARLASAQANKQTAQLALKRTRVYAPVAARVVGSTLDVGQTVSPGQTVGRLVSVGRIEIAAPVSQSQLAILAPARGRVAEYSQRGSLETTDTAEVVRVDASLDERTRLSNLYLQPTAVDGLLIGDFVDLSLQTDPIANTHIIPATALTGQNSLWVVEAGQLAYRNITVLGERAAGLELLVAPFDTGDGVVALPPLEAETGQAVTPRPSQASVNRTEGQDNDGR